MARISEQVIEQIRSISDIYEIVSDYVQLKKKGRNYFGLCPFHDEKTPSFSINHERQIYKCFGCGSGGGTINFIMEIERLEFIDAIKLLADKYKIELNIDNINNKNKGIRTKLIELHEKTSHLFLENLNTEHGKKVVQHLMDRGLKKETIKNFKLGYSLKKPTAILEKIRSMELSANIMRQSGLFIDTEKGYIDRFRGRIMFSIMDISGKVIAFAGRVFESNEQAKYVNSPETTIYNKSRILYGLHASKEAIRKNNLAIIVEGYLDFLQLFQSGIENCVAISGTAFTEQHALQIKRQCNTVILAYDGDNAGKKAAIKAGYILLRAGLSVKIMQIPNGMDPDDWVKKSGKEPFIEAMDKGKKLLNFHYDNFSGDLKSTSGKTTFINDVLMELSQLKDPVSRELHVHTLSEIIKISFNSIFESLQKIMNNQKKYIKNEQEKNESIINTNNVNSLIEEDLIRLCFSNKFEIRNYLFENINPKWLTSNVINQIYDKVYIHLHSKNKPEIELIMNELNKKEEQNKLAEILFDLEKIDDKINAAHDCTCRLEKKWLDDQLVILRKNLKQSINNKNDSHKIMEEINTLQNQKKNLNHIKSNNE